MVTLPLDLKLALRSLRARPRFVALVLLTLAVGIGSNVGLFAYLKYFVRPTLDAPDASSLVWIHTESPTSPRGASSYLDLQDVKSASGKVLSQVEIHRIFITSVSTPSRQLYAYGHAVNEDYFSLYGAKPHLGRLIGPSDNEPGSEPVVVLSHLTWSRHFQSDPRVLGRTLLVDGRYPYTVVGVARSGFQGEGLWTGVYVPLATAGALVPGFRDRDDLRFNAVARLAPGVSLEHAREAVSLAGRFLDESYPREEPRRLAVIPVEEPTVAAQDPIVASARILMVAVALLLILACANIASLLLAHGTARRRELAVHAALGCGRLRLARQLLVESLLLSLAGGVLGLGLARGVTRLIEHYLRQEIPLNMGEWAAGTTIIIDETAAGFFTLGIIVVTGLLFGAAPALQAVATPLATTLKGDRTSSAPGRLRSFQNALVSTQVALSIVLLVSAGLLGRTLINVSDVEPGFDAEGLMVAGVYAPPLERREEAGRTMVGTSTTSQYDELLRAVRGLPGVEAAALAARIPASYHGERRAEAPSGGEQATVSINVVGTDFFEVLGVPLLQGRSFAPEDDDENPKVVVISQTAAEALFPGSDPLGQELSLMGHRPESPAESFRVIGVVADFRHDIPSLPHRPIVYHAFAQRPQGKMNIMVRGPVSLRGPLHELIRDVFPGFALISLAPFSEQQSRAVAGQRMNAELSGGLGALGLLLAALGIFSVLSFTVSHSVREIGLRRALGAQTRTLMMWILLRSARPVILGIVVGVAGALALARLLQSQLLGVATHDLQTLLGVSLAVLAVSLVAAWLPARRATRISPLEALRA